MMEARGTGRQRLLEHHNALAGLAPEELQGKGTAGRRAVETLAAARGYDEAFCCGHPRVSFPGVQRGWTTTNEAGGPFGPLRDRLNGPCPRRRPARRRRPASSIPKCSSP